VRCSSCEPLLDAYLERALRPRHSFEVTAHLRACAHCTALLRELRVVDALLTTARRPQVAADVTAAVVSAAHAIEQQASPRPPLGFALLLYLGIAWTLILLAALRLHDVARLAATFSAVGQSDLSALGGVVRFLTPATLLATLAVITVLMLDLLLLYAIFAAYRRVRPLIAPYLDRGRRL
jgi:anti-sigma factor RsiW